MRLNEKTVREFETSDLRIEIREFPQDSNEVQLDVTLRHGGTESIYISGGEDKNNVEDKHEELTIGIHESERDMVILRTDITFLDLLEQEIKRYRKYHKKKVK